MRRPGRVAAVVLAVLLLGGCATIPTTGRVSSNDPTQAADGDASIVYRPNGPVDGADPQDIVSGFVQAASAGGPYSVAKEFLTPQFARTWKPNERVLIHVDSWTSKKAADDRVELRVPVAATVDSDGAFAPVAGTSAPQQPRSIPFQLVRVNNQWRISAGPTGVILAQRVFQRLFSPVALQFWDPAYKRFVPDVRWLPYPSSTRPSTTVRTLLAGQADPLKGVTSSAFPTGTRLIGSVADRDGLTYVDVAVQDRQPDRQATDRMQQQVAATLGGVPASSVRLTVNGRAVPAAPQAEVQQASSQDPVVIQNGRFGTLTARGLREDRSLGPVLVRLRPRALTVSPRQQLAAVLTSVGQVQVVARNRPRVVDSRPGLIAPTIDQQGWVYSVPASDPAGLVATPASGDAVRVPTDLGGSSVLAIEASEDGTRMLVLIQRDTGPEAYVAGIRRDADGRPTGLTSAHFLVPLSVDGAVGATWADSTSAAVLTSATSGATAQSVILQRVPGIAQQLGPLPSSARALAGANEATDLRVLLQSGELVQQSANIWQREFDVAVDATVLAIER